MRKQPVAEQIVLVSGASSGVGRAVARELGARGARVVVSARNGEALANAVAEVERAGGSGLAVPLDLAEEGAADELVRRTVDRFGGLDAVVCSAMVTVYAELERLERAELRRVVEVDFLARVDLFRAALPALRRSHGTFVDVNSALAYRGIPLQSAYCASKAAMRTLLESARVELDKAGARVDVVVVLPGAINTPQFDRARQKLGLQPQPVPPIYEPEPVAGAIVRALERPVRELPVGWGAQKLLWGQKLSPRAGDLVLRRTGWKGQTTGAPKPVDSPDNVFATVTGDPGAHGRFGDRSRRSSAWTALRLNRGKAAAGAVLALATMAGTKNRVFGVNKKDSDRTKWHFWN